MHVLVGCKTIATELGLGDPRRVRVLVTAGAPVRVVTGPRRDPRGRRYLADLDALSAWLRCRE